MFSTCRCEQWTTMSTDVDQIRHAKPRSSGGSVDDLRTGGNWVTGSNLGSVTILSED